MRGGAVSHDPYLYHLGHPDSRGGHLCHGLANAYREGAIEARGYHGHASSCLSLSNGQPWREGI